MKRLPVALVIGVYLALAGLTGTAAAKTVIVPRPPISTAQRIFQGIEHFDPHDRFWLDPQGGDVETNNQSSITFACLTCGAYDSDGWFLDYYTSHRGAVSNTISTIQLEGPPPYFPIYLAGNATMTGPAPLRVIRAFSEAVRKPVVTYRHS
jgi:hypothetical protein